MVKVVLSIPNWLTLIRVGLIPIFVIFLIDPSPWMLEIALWIFIVAALTDYLDGIIARHFGSVSDFGKLLDPLADKILVLSALIMLSAQRSDIYGDPWVPGWMVVMVVAREIWITGLRGVAAGQGSIIAANQTGKLKSFLQMLSIVFLLLQDKVFKVLGFSINYQFVGLILLFLSLVFSYWAAVEYTMVVFFPKSEKA